MIGLPQAMRIVSSSTALACVAATGTTDVRVFVGAVAYLVLCAVPMPRGLRAAVDGAAAVGGLGALGVLGVDPVVLGLVCGVAGMHRVRGGWTRASLWLDGLVLLWVGARVSDPSFWVGWGVWMACLVLGGIASLPARRPRQVWAWVAGMGAVAVAWYLAVPRLAVAGDADVGLHDAGAVLDLRTFDALRDDPAIVAHVRGWVPEERVYLRLAAYEAFDGRSWREGPDWRSDARGEARGPLHTQRVEVAQTAQDGAVAVPLPVLWFSEGRDPLGWGPRQTMRTQRPDQTVVYTAHAGVDGPFGPTGLGEAHFRALLAIPPSVRARVDAIVDAIPPGWTFEDDMRLVHRWLADNARYARVGWPEEVAPLDHFLGTGRAGHCELFATASVMLLRARGVPARLAVGWVGRADAHGVVTLRQQDAHAWTEVHIYGLGWVRLDTTLGAPSARVATPPPPDAGGRVSVSEDAPASWGQRWTSFDRATQWAVWKGLLPLAALVALTALAWTLRKRRQQTARVVADGVASDWAEARRLLAERGHHPPAHLPPLAASVWLGKREPAIADALARLATLHAEVRFGGRAAEERRAESAACLEAIAAHLRA